MATIPCRSCFNFYFAFLNGKKHRECFEYHLEHGADIEYKNMIGETPLIEAMESKEDFMYYARKLVEKDANVNYRTESGETALHNAAFYGKDEAIRFLVLKGAKINFIGGSYGTPLTRAILGKKEKCVKVLLSLGADPNIRDKSGNTPLYIVVFQTINEVSIKIIEHLLRHGADPYEQNANGETAYNLSEKNKAVRDLFDSSCCDIGKEPDCY